MEIKSHNGIDGKFKDIVLILGTFHTCMSFYVIEQELMHSLKSMGGMTRGRGMDELQCEKFILSTPSCSEMKCALDPLTKIAYKSREQHKSSRPSRIHRDYTDATKIL